jgi:hypothetical protein
MESRVQRKLHARFGGGSRETCIKLSGGIVVRHPARRQGARLLPYGTCKHLLIDPFAYLRDVFIRLPSLPPDRLGELLPGYEPDPGGWHREVDR